METRALAIAFFYAIGTAVGGVSGPLLFANLIGSGVRGQVELAFFIGAAVMAIGGIAEIFLGVPSEQAQLEDIAKPLTVEEAEAGGGAAGKQSGAEAPGDQPDEEASPERQEALRALRDAEEARARGAEHRASAHELRATGSNGSADERAEIEERLAEIADLHAQAPEENAAACEECAERKAGDEAALERMRAAEQRAVHYRERAEALGAADEAEARRHQELAEAASERARASEQRAAAAQARSEAEHEQPMEVARARAGMH